MSRFFAMEERELEKIISLHNDLEKIKAEASRKDIQEITAIIKSEIENMGDLFEVKDGIAHIPIVGELAEQPAMSAALFGKEQTTFGSIIDNINKAENDPMVEKIVFEIDSVGGTVHGTDQTAMAIRAMQKPTESHVHNMAASAAFWLAAQTGKIIAMTPTVEVGSIGVAAEIIDTSEADKQAGIKIHKIVSTGAEKKDMNVSTTLGRSEIKERLNEVHEIFIQRISEGRNVSEETVREDFGKGGLVIASKALKVGMIDGIMDGKELITAKSKKKKINKHKAENDILDELNAQGDHFNIATEPAKGAGKNKQEVSNMTKEEFKAQNPDLYNQIYNEGKEAGIEKERDRVKAHLTLGNQAGAMEAAIKHIEEGDGMTQAITAEYLAAGMNKNDLASRQEEDVKLGNFPTSDKGDDGNAQFAQALNEQLGLVQEAV